jgi:hypothetical protein
MSTPTALILAPTATRSYATVTLDGSSSRDTGGTLKTYTWSQTSGPTVTLAGATTSAASFIAPSVKASTSLGFTLKLTDSTGATATASATVNVIPAGASRTTPKFVALHFLQTTTGNFHTDALVVDGPPLIGASSPIKATLAGFVQTPTFTITDVMGNSLGSATLNLSSATDVQPLEFTGSMTVPSQPFYITASGTTADGQNYTLNSPLMTPMNMSATFIPARAELKPGASGTANLIITNGGADATFTVHFVDPNQLLSSPVDVSQLISQGKSFTLSVPITFPSSLTAHASKVLANVFVSGDASRNGVTVLTVWRDGRP